MICCPSRRRCSISSVSRPLKIERFPSLNSSRRSMTSHSGSRLLPHTLLHRKQAIFPSFCLKKAVDGRRRRAENDRCTKHRRTRDRRLPRMIARYIFTLIGRLVLLVMMTRPRFKNGVKSAERGPMMMSISLFLPAETDRNARPQSFWNLTPTLGLRNGYKSA